MSPDEIRRILEFYQDLGIKSIYRRGSQLVNTPAPEPEPESALSFDQLPPMPPRAPRPGVNPPPRQAAPPVNEESLSWDDLPPLPPKSGRLAPPVPTRPSAPPARQSSPPSPPAWDSAATLSPTSGVPTPSAPPAAPSLDNRPAQTGRPAQSAPSGQSAWNEMPPLPPKTGAPPPSAPAWDDLPATPPARSIIQPPPAPVMASTNKIDLIPLAPENDSLDRIRTDIGDCKRCRLCEGRNKIVFGSGNESSPLVFVGEGPGADEDASGLPFVGRAGQLLTQMIDGTASKEGIAIKRADVFICNVVKCRPPENRAPQPDEMEICGQFLFRQLSAIKPKAICALGSTAAKAVLGTKEGVTKLRGNWHKWGDVPVMVTYHPSYLLRPYNQNAKREAWEDLKKVLHFVYD